MKVELWRKIGTAEEKVEGAEVKEFTDSITTAKWTNLEETDGEGNKYTYFTKEDFKDKTDIKNENWTLGKYDENTKSFTNSVKAPTGKLTIKIVLENEFIAIARRSLLNGTPLKFKVKVTGPFNYEETISLVAGQSMTLENLYSGEYKVEEVEAHGYIPSYAPESGKVEVRAGTTSEVTITNKNTGGGNAIDITVTKVWNGGLETKPEATIELWRKGLDLENKEINEKVEEFKATVDEKTKTFTNLAKHDPSGGEFEYYVKEPTVPTNYTAKIDGFKVTNTYTPEKRDDIKGTKSWDHGSNPISRQPNKVTIILKANGVEVNRKDITEKDNWKYDFGEMLINDGKGNEILYTIDELSISNYTKTITGFNIKNKYIEPYVPTEPEPEPSEPSEPSEPVEPDEIRAELNKDDHFAYMIGYPGDIFKPNGNITRAEAVTIFFRMLTSDSRNRYWSTENNFNDVRDNSWYNNALSTMENAKIISVDSNGNFRPNDNMTRAEFAVLLMNFFNERGVKSHKFTDISGHWAEEEIAKVADKGWISGYLDKTFRPDEPISRAETAKLVNEILERTPDKDNLLPNMKEFKDNMNKDRWYYVEIQEATNSHEYTRKDNKSKEIWKRLLPTINWAELEKEWSNINSITKFGDIIK